MWRALPLVLSLSLVSCGPSTEPATGCQDSSECTDEDTICWEGQCLQPCGENFECDPGTRCDFNDGYVCVQCFDDSHCAEGDVCDDRKQCVHDGPARGVDVLFVIDNGLETEEEHAALGEAFDGFIAALVEAHGSKPDLHIGVV